jgi:hypothetical protein
MPSLAQSEKRSRGANRCVRQVRNIALAGHETAETVPTKAHHPIIRKENGDIASAHPWRAVDDSLRGNGKNSPMANQSGKTKLWLLTGLVPAIMLVVFARQIYLKHSAQLSTWKGGGMGMFAAADGSNNRFTKVYINSPQRGRQPIIRLTLPQKRLMDKAVWYPVRSSFQRAADLIFATNWATSDLPTAVSQVNSAGKQIAASPIFYHMIYPYGPRLSTDRPDWDLEIEYWAMSYNPDTRRIQAKLVTTHRFGAPS